MNLTLVVVGADAKSLDRFAMVEQPDKLIMMANLKKRSIASIANARLAVCDTEVFGIVHADTYFGQGALKAFADAAAIGAVSGIVGVTPVREYVWCMQNPGPAHTLDCCSVFFRPDSGLAFDERTFDGFHCYVEDLCMLARSRGLDIVVPAADANHSGVSTGRTDWQEQFRMYRKRLFEKWPGAMTT